MKPLRKSISRLQIIIALIVTIVTFFSTCKSPLDSKKQAEPDTVWLEEISISDIRKGYIEGKYTVSQVVKGFLDRIDQIDRNGPQLNSIIAVNPEAMAIAAELDKALAAGNITGPLFGIPVILKDNIDSKDNMPTTAGATILRNNFLGSDSPVAARLRAAGAVIIAKANLSEWANFRAETSSSGWSGVGGQVKNPYILDRNPCGSSSGSGAAVAASLCVVAIGTETNGSIVCPSNNNGIVGIKPTVGLISRTGIIPISFTQDTPGPMARTVEDAARCLGVLTGIDVNDSKTLASEGKSLSDYTGSLKIDGLKGKRIGVIRNSAAFSEKVDTLFRQAIRVMVKNGAEVIEVQPPSRGEYNASSYQVLLYEFKDGLNKYLSATGDNVTVKSLKDLIEFNKTDTIELKYFDQKILIEAESKGDLNSKEYQDALARMLKATREDGIDRMMKENRLDALIAPTGSPAWKTDLVLGDHFVGGSSSLAAIAGYPAITVPMGFISGLPVDITFFGKAWSEPVLIEIAYSFEQATKHRKAPEYLVSD